MERFSQRESVLLGYSSQSQRSFMNNYASPKAEQRNSDIDFNDVFGGPPRLSSIQETRCSYSQGTDDCAFTGDDGAVISRRSWNGLREQPVFGEEGFNRRRYTSENFFDDIFKGNESLSSSPRKRDWDPYSSSPGSQVLSPSRPLPPKAQPFGTSLPAQFSLPAKLTKGMELPTFGSASRSPNKSKDVASNGISFYSSPLSRSSSLNKGGHEERNDNRSSHRQSILSREFSLSSKESSNLIGSAEVDRGAGSKKELNSSEVLTSSNKFHFSIYKWASNGVPLIMPLRGGSSLRSRVNSNTDRCSSSDGWKAKESELSTETLHETKLSSNVVLPNAKSFVMENSRQNNSIPPDTSTQDRVEMQQRVDTGNTTSQNTGEEINFHYKSEIVLHDKLEKVYAAEEAHKAELKTLHSLFYDHDDEQSNKEITKKATEKERTAESTKKASVVPDFSKHIKEQDEKRATLERAEVGKGSRQGSPMNSRDPGKISSKGRVQDFVKIFNQVGLSKSKISVDSQSQTTRWRSASKSNAEKESNFSKIGTDKNIHKSRGFEKKSSSDAPTMVNENLPHSEKQQSSIKNTFCMPNGTSGQKENSSSGNALKAVIGDTEESFPENFLVKELAQDENKLPRPGKGPEDIQAIDAKIQIWSNGKDRNIRSLLSTLQYVLWPESGWKTVPLVDIIEGSAVKRSYQKALLCLHPDKLQQKGSTSEQKYIAQKVFDVLQEAWTHFNSLGSL